MGYVAKLTKNGQTLIDLSAGRYRLADGFTLPGANLITSVAGGTAINRYGGGEVIGTRAVNRDWTLRVIVSGSSSGEVERGIQDLEQALRQAGDENSPMYFEWRSDSNVSFEPLWGQWNTNKRLEIVAADGRALWDMYAVASLRNSTAVIGIGMEIKPCTLGKQQQLALSAGGVLEDWVGLTRQGDSRGIITPPATTNNFTNPIFGHTTWNNTWTAGTNLQAVQNTNTTFLLFGRNSVKLTNSDASSARTYTQSLAGSVATYTISFYVKRQDGAAVTSSDCTAIGNGSSQTTTFTAQGNGWYRATASFTGQVAAETHGIRVTVGRTLFADGFQVELGSVATPLCYGDMLGCAWTGTAHASTSTRTAAEVNLTTSVALSLAQGTACVVWIPLSVTETYATDQVFFSNGASSFKLWWDGTNKLIKFTDGVNTTSADAGTIITGTAKVFYATWQPGRIDLYIASSQEGTSLFYTPPTLAANLNIGSDATPANHVMGTLSAVTFYDRAMTQAEITADYNNLIQIVNDGQRVDWLPHFWTKDGDGVTDNCDDSTADNWGVAAGIPGVLPAETYISGYTTYGGLSSKYDLWLSNWVLDNFIYPTGRLFQDENTTIPPDATLCGTGYTATTLNTTESDLSTLSVQDADWGLAGKEVYLFTRLYDAGANLQLRFRFSNSSVTIQTDLLAVTSGTTYRLYKIGNLAPLNLENFKQRWDNNIVISSTSCTCKLRGVRSAAGSADVRVDYIALMPVPLMRIIPPTLPAAASWYFTLDSIGVIEHTSAYGWTGVATLVGTKPFELQPGKVNVLSNFVGNLATADQINFSLTYSKIIVKPRWTI